MASAFLLPGSTFGKSGLPTTSTFKIKASIGNAKLLGEGQPATKVWHYNGSVPGPVLRLKQGQESVIKFKNGLAQPTTVHWHGLRIDNKMDGVPGMTQELIKPGKSFTYRFTPPDAGTYWYHPHNKTWEQLARGLYGIILVEEKAPPVVDQDLVLVFDDWLISQTGQIHEESFGAMHDWAHGGREGNWVTVNGKPQPEFAVKTGERLRLRLVNVANSRVMPLQFNGLNPFLLAIDGQPIAPTPVAMAPGQRFDVMVDMEQDPGSRATIDLLLRNNSYKLTRFAYDKKTAVRQHTLDAPINLPDNPLNNRLDLESAKRVDLIMQGGAMGGSTRRHVPR